MGTVTRPAAIGEVPCSSPAPEWTEGHTEYTQDSYKSIRKYVSTGTGSMEGESQTEMCKKTPAACVIREMQIKTMRCHLSYWTGRKREGVSWCDGKCVRTGERGVPTGAPGAASCPIQGVHALKEPRHSCARRHVQERVRSTGHGSAK